MNRLRVLNLVLLDIRVSSQSTATGYPDVPPVHRSTNKCYLSLRVHKLVRLSIKELVRFVHRHVSCTSCNSFRVNFVPMCLWFLYPIEQVQLLELDQLSQAWLDNLDTAFDMAF